MAVSVSPLASSPHRPTERLLLVGALKAVGSQLIVLHHLAFYGPMSDWMHRLWPRLVEWLSQDARMAVQVFLVVSGFLAVRSLAPAGVLRTADPLALLRRRYLRTALPYLAALLLAMWCAEVARFWMVHDSIPEPPDFWAFVSHALLMHTVFDVESLSAGVWYVAIDFQLYALLLGLLWLARRWGSAWWAAGLVALAVTASLYHFNRDPDWDAWALYFMGAYGLGALTCWAAQPARSPLWMAALAAVVLGALWLDFRERIALALAVALLLAWALRGGWLSTWPRSRCLAWLGNISYAVFLLNFPVALVVNAWFTRYAPPDPWVQSLGVLLGWGLCNLAGAAFHTWVERPLGRWGR